MPVKEMELDKLVYDYITKELKCFMRVESGIVTIITPEGAKWDFTEIMKVSEK